jgi:hypothetical protein
MSEEARLAIAAALNDMRRKTSDLKAFAPRHESASMSSSPTPYNAPADAREDSLML